MFITDRSEIAKFNAVKRLWQGIPSVEVTKKGRISLTYYSGGIKEEIGNFAILTSSDSGEDFQDVRSLEFAVHKIHKKLILQIGKYVV